MTKEIKDNIIIPAWNIIKDDSNIKKYYLFPGLLSILFLTILLVYQSLYLYVELFGKKEEALVIMLKFFHSDYVIELSIVVILFLIIYFFLTPIFEGGLIKYIKSKDTGDNISTGKAFSEGVYNFLPLLKYNNMFSEFKIISIINGYLFIIRFIGVEYIKIISYIFLVLLFLGILLNIFLSYSKYLMILENKKLFEAIGISSKMTILNFRKTVKLYLLMLFLNLRVIFNFIIFLSFPLIMILAIGFITTKIFLVLAIAILSILFIIFIMILGYLTAVLEIFKSSVWYFAYKDSYKQLEDKK